MKAKRFAALCLSLVLTLSLLTVPAGAVSFTDMQGHWAQEDVEYLAGLGIVKGTSSTTFSPAQKMTACEALLFCSRTTGVSASDKAQIAADRAVQLREILPSEVYSWAEEEMAVCLETGIISVSELEAMCTSGALLKSITRENLSMYLVRAMQLAPMAASLTSYPMSFADTVSISQVLRPYVYLLNTYGIVVGNTANQFMPQGSLTRAEMATMLRRAIDFMDEQGIYAELPAYTDYPWTGGVIDQVETAADGTVRLTFTSALAGSDTVTLTAQVPIYENNIRTTPAALRAGKYARVNLDGADGSILSLRLAGAVTAFTGTVTALSQESITLEVDGTSKRLDIDRFTRVQAGQTVGDASLIDVTRGYTKAQCWVDGMGHLAELKLSGGGYNAEGFLTGLSGTAGSQRLTVTAFDGSQAQYTLSAGTEITVDGAGGSITSASKGAYIALQVEGDGTVSAAALDTRTDYAMGPVKSVSFATDPYQITLEDAFTGSVRTYPIGADAQAWYDGAEIPVQEVTQGSYATLQLKGGQAVLLDTYPGTAVTEGVLQSIVYANPTTLVVLTDQGVETDFTVDLNDLPRVVRDGKVSSLDKLRTGDRVAVTVRYHQLTDIEALSRSDDLSGVITRVVQDTTGVTIVVSLSDGTVRSFQVSEGVPVTSGGSVSSPYALKPNDTVELSVNGDEVTAIQISGSSPASVQLTGTVLLVNTAEQTIMLQLEDDSFVVVYLEGAGFVTAAGSAWGLSQVKPGDSVQVYGQYSGSAFVATLVIRL